MPQPDIAGRLPLDQCWQGPGLLLLCWVVPGAQTLQRRCIHHYVLEQGDFEAFLKWVAYPFIPSKSAMYQPGNNSSWPKVALDGPLVPRADDDLNAVAANVLSTTRPARL